MIGFFVEHVILCAALGTEIFESSEVVIEGEVSLGTLVVAGLEIAGQLGVDHDAHVALLGAVVRTDISDVLDESHRSPKTGASVGPINFVPI